MKHFKVATPAQEVSEASSNVGRCNRCGAMQRLDQCKQLTYARLDLITETESHVQGVMAFSEVLEEICQGTPTVEKLLVCEDFDATVSEKDVIVKM